MGLEITLLGAAISGLAGWVFSLILAGSGLDRNGRARVEGRYSEKLSELASKLESSSREVDSVLREIGSAISVRRGAVDLLETRLVKLTAEEDSIRKRISALKETRIEVAEHFAAAVSSGERRSARRDYMLFGAGVLVSTAISAILQLSL